MQSERRLKRHTPMPSNGQVARPIRVASRLCVAQFRTSSPVTGFLCSAVRLITVPCKVLFLGRTFALLSSNGTLGRLVHIVPHSGMFPSTLCRRAPATASTAPNFISTAPIREYWRRHEVTRQQPDLTRTHAHRHLFCSRVLLFAAVSDGWRGLRHARTHVTWHPAPT